MIPTKIFVLVWTALLSLSLFTTVIITLTSLETADAYPMIRTRTGTFGKIRHARRHAHKEFIQSNIDEFPLICPAGHVRGHNNKCHPVWPGK